VSLLTLAAEAFPNLTARKLSATGLVVPIRLLGAPPRVRTSVHPTKRSRLPKLPHPQGTTCTWPSGRVSSLANVGLFILFHRLLSVLIYAIFTSFYVTFALVREFFCFFILSHVTKTSFSTRIRTNR